MIIATLRKNVQSHGPATPLFCGNIAPEDTVRNRKMDFFVYNGANHDTPHIDCLYRIDEVGL